MKIKLNRKSILILGYFIIIVFLSLNRINDINKSVITSGKIIGYKEWENKTFPEDVEKAAVVLFYNGKKENIFIAQRNVDYESGQIVRVIYKKQNVTNAKIFSFTGYWLEPIIICLIPLIIFSALTLTFIKKDDRIIFKPSDKELYNKNIGEKMEDNDNIALKQ
jgi:hypothetical protein